MKLKIFDQLLVLVAILLIALSGNLNAQTHIRPFEAPSDANRQIVKKNKLQASLRFGYLRDNKEAESLRSRTEYNKEGFPLMSYEFGNKGQIQAKKVYTYDQSATKILTAEIEVYQGDNELQLALFYRFDEAGRLLEYRETDERGKTRRMGCTYNARNQILVMQFFEADGLPGASEVYGYDNAGNQISLESFDIAGDLSSKIISEYDSKNRLVKQSEYLKENFLLYTSTFAYDEQGRLSKRSKRGRSGDEIQTESWKYNSYGLCIEHQIKEREDEKPLREVCKYDSKRRKIEEIVYNPDGNIFQWYKYEFDSTGTGCGYSRLRPDGKDDYVFTEKYDQKRQLLEAIEQYPDGTGNKHRFFKYQSNGLLMEEKHLDFGEEESVFWFVYEQY